MSAKAQILGLAQALANGQCDAQTIADYFDDVVEEMNNEPWLTTATLLPVAAGQTSFSPPDRHVKTLGVVYDDLFLSPASLRELEWTDSHWRDLTGSPVAYTEEDEDTKTFRMFPVPALPSAPYSFVTGAPLGGDYPTYTALLFHTETRDTLPDWLDLPVALLVLARDFARESRYRDPVMAKFCADLGALCLRWVA